MTSAGPELYVNQASLKPSDLSAPASGVMVLKACHRIWLSLYPVADKDYWFQVKCIFVSLTFYKSILAVSKMQNKLEEKTAGKETCCYQLISALANGRKLD